MKKILLSVLTIALVSGVAFGASRAYFSDVETSTGNTFTAGELDLKLTNNSSASDGVINNSAIWTDFDDMDGRIMMNYSDIKPGDYGENSVSLKVLTNDAWSCVRVYDVTDDENGQTSAEALVDTDPAGELSSALNFIWWVDTDGNNSLGESEQVMFNGPVTLAQIKAKEYLTLADSAWNAFTFSDTGPLLGDTDYKLGIGWCLGAITEDATTRQTAPGFTCDGSVVNNSIQTDKVTGTLEFKVTQSRNQLEFLCPERAQ